MILNKDFLHLRICFLEFFPLFWGKHYCWQFLTYREEKVTSEFPDEWGWDLYITPSSPFLSLPSCELEMYISFSATTYLKFDRGLLLLGNTPVTLLRSLWGGKLLNWELSSLPETNKTQHLNFNSQWSESSVLDVIILDFNPSWYGLLWAVI